MALPLLSHTCAAVLSTYMWMCAKGAILGVKSRICISINPSSRSFIVTSPVGLEEDTMRAWVVREKREIQTKYWTSASWHTYPIPYPYALVVPNQLEEKGSNLRMWVGLMARLQTNSRQALRTSCTSVVR